MVADDTNDWVNKADEKRKQQLDQNTQQNHNEIGSEMIRANNVDLLSQMVVTTRLEIR